jgi:hypothetical protein
MPLWLSCMALLPMRLRSDFVASAIIRQAGIANCFAALRRRGAAEAGAILIKVDRLDGTAALYGPAPQAMMQDVEGERFWHRLHKTDVVTSLDAEARIDREIGFDPDLWLIEIEDREGRPFAAVLET